jgi:hypothetical protein
MDRQIYSVAGVNKKEVEQWGGGRMKDLTVGGKE